MRARGVLRRALLRSRAPLRSAIAPRRSVTRRWFWGASQDAPVVCKQFQDVRTSYKLGPELGAEVESNKQRRGLKKLLSLAITLGMLHDSLSAEVAEGRRRAEQT